MKQILSVLMLMLVALTPMAFVQAVHTDVRHDGQSDRAFDRAQERALEKETDRAVDRIRETDELRRTDEVTGHVVYDERQYDERVRTDKQPVLHDVKEDVIKDHKTDRATLEVEHDAIPQEILDFGALAGINSQVLAEIPGFPADLDIGKITSGKRKPFILGDVGLNRIFVGSQYPQGHINYINYGQGEVYFDGVFKGTGIVLYKPTTTNSGFYTVYFRDENGQNGQWAWGAYGELKGQPVALLAGWGQVNTMNLYAYLPFSYV